ncbi:twitching motility protein PilT [Nostoc linckia z18]|uniref:Twitching motility protein PilT n=2 Tax=Nostoc linckia TaxID=92942 RepID=A0A9Q5Z9F9_NOSLI|nr:type II toxin-antitoxin system VapC family toxin [Nostoc linckia]PHK34981.1 twitching motility protein PilT [Nostoc linckia z15]PHK45651.1 twitching motility protein PilT [Nostoc linckia z16]PHJ63285.1 twitching motility protein PilT [Nostoc linckia z1]PHJ64442.1 twitching motility protein PilT [Nostoc linckia z3]PHJ73916.1 twitching motility protein PilT [Nostoc linckia z2]
MTYLLDTNIVSYILRRNVTVGSKLRDANRSGQEVFISCITYYEVKRGLLYANATKQLADFNAFSRKYEILFLDDIEIIEKACEIHVDLQRRGLTIQEQDILIAATAIARGLILVSNDYDLQRVQGINLENWSQTDS